MRDVKRILPFRWEWIAVGLWLIGHGVANAQVPGLPGTPPLPGQNARSKAPDAPAAEKTDAAVATPSGPIVLEKPIKDSTIREALEHLLPKYPGVRSAQVDADHGVVTLDGQVENEDVLEGVTQFTRRVEGVRLVLNRMKTDAQVLTAWRFGAQLLERTWTTISREWFVVVIAVAIFMAFLGLARLLADLCGEAAGTFHHERDDAICGRVTDEHGPGRRGSFIVAFRAGPDPPGPVDSGRCGNGGPGRRVCLPRHRRELHRLDPARHTPALSDRGLHSGRRAHRRGQVAEHTRHRAGHARRETDPDPEQHHLQGNPDQLVGLAHLARRRSTY